VLGESLGAATLAEATLLHQRVTEKTPVEVEAAHVHELAGQRLGLVEAVQRVEHVTEQQKGLGAVWCSRRHASAALLGERPVARVVAPTRLGGEQPAESLEPEK
jgi:hypothetical protein